MDLILTIISGLIVLNIVVIVHEYGHYITAKKAGVYAPTFAIGFGPTLWTFYKNTETSFELKAIPFGGYVRMASSYEGESLEIPKGKKTLEQTSKLTQIWIISAGAIFNFILTVVIYFIIGLFHGNTTMQTQVVSVEKNYPAYNVLQKNDIILKINNSEVYNPQFISSYIQKDNKIEILRNNKNIKLNVQASKSPNVKNKYVLGMVSKMTNIKTTKGFMGGIYNIVNTLRTNIDMQILTFKMLFSGQAKVSDLSGPVGIIRNTGTIISAKVSWSDKLFGFLNWLGLISFAIGFANLILFILPVVDGGRIFLIILSAIFKRDLSQSKVVEYLMMGCIAIMLTFFVYITFIDLFRHI